MIRAALVLLGIGLIVALFVLTANEPPRYAEVGQPAPEIGGDFAINGPPVTLAALRGKVVLLDFWAVTCGPCIAGFGHMRDWSARYKEQGLEIIGITTYQKDADERAREQQMLKEFTADHELPYCIQVGAREDLEKMYSYYKVQYIPHVVLIDRRGNVRMVKVGAGEDNARALESEIRKLLEEK
jgi:peroxiredoxin